MMPRTLATSHAELKKDIERYFSETHTDEWEIMRLVPQLLKKYTLTEITADQALLRKVYEEALKAHSSRQKQKCPMTTKELDALVLSNPVRKLFLKVYNGCLAEERALEAVGEKLQKKPRLEHTAEDDQENNEGERTSNVEQRDPKAMTMEELLENVADDRSEHGIKGEDFWILDTTGTEAGQNPIYRCIKSRLGSKLQMASTERERKWLVEFARCKTQKDIDKLLASMFQVSHYTATESYIRTAINCLSNLWKSGVLNDDNNEGWLQANLYSQVFDAVFIEQSHIITKRSETIYMTLKTARGCGVDVQDRKIDFILKSKDDDVDLLSVEDKPKETKKVAADREKTSLIQQLTLYLWRKKLGRDMSVMVAELEAITCQWTGSKLEILGTRLLSDTFVYYEKAEVRIPTVMKCAQAALALLTIISLKRALYLNYEKLEKMMEIRAMEQVANLDLLSQTGSESDLYPSMEDYLKEIRSIAYDSSVLTNQDWEQICRLRKRETKQDRCAHCD
ncbi:hypothetical protein BGX28_005161 [Mortierella sp. GBA30]|nr:hypothetical protein BGX28_005161 [Mortierella sp. GBA30]